MCSAICALESETEGQVLQYKWKETDLSDQLCYL